MGPRSDERGNGQPLRKSSQPSSLLQWGRAQMSAEITAQPRNCFQCLVASMGPRSDERGNGLDAVLVECRLIQLQWGRAQMSAEMFA